MDEFDTARTPPSELKKSLIDENDKDSVEDFQKFIYELFEKNGILNDLRAYLRRHIIDVLKSSHAGASPLCQKQMSQRLEVKTQAMNVLIAEYLMRMDFKYSLSVFVSEIPLANMVFDFASKLMKGDAGDNLYFGEKDVWSIISYIGLKCDISIVKNILEMYKNERQPLLQCIIRSFPALPIEFPCKKPAQNISSGTSSDDTASSDRSSDIKCKLSSMNASSLMKNMDVIEGGLVEEMFEQLKSVYEAELEMLRVQQDRRVQRTVDQHAHDMCELKQQMEDSFKAREEELERGVRAKKKFLWSLARSLRAQHQQLARAMASVKHHTQRLRAKEENLKAHLAEVEQLLKSRGADMQAAISSELVSLEGQLTTVRREREAVNKERSELEQLRRQMSASHNNIDIDAIEALSEHTWSNYDLVSNELSILRKYIETSRDLPKCVVERGTVTDIPANATSSATAHAPAIASAPLLNNEQEVKIAKEEDNFKNNQLVNDFKKQKNVNFCVISSENLMSRQCTVSEPPPDTLETLRADNQRLKEYARQQEQLISRMRMMPPPRPRTAPASPPPRLPDSNVQDGLSGSREFPACCKLGFRWAGSGEGVMTSACRPQVFVPGESVPFIGLMHERRADSKRLVNQWRPAPRRPSPRRRHADNNYTDNASVHENENLANSSHEADVLTLDPELSHAQVPPPRAKSPKSVLREAKEKLRQNSKEKYQVLPPSTPTRDKSPATVLREAKLRLKKLEIEAEAVEKSYRDYRKRQSELRSEREHSESVKGEALVTKDVGDLTYEIGSAFAEKNRPPSSIKSDNPPSIPRDYQGLYMSETQFSNRNTTAAKMKPIPEAFGPTVAWAEHVGKQNIQIENFVETPLAEFQKYYRRENDKGGDIENSVNPGDIDPNCNNAGAGGEHSTERNVIDSGPPTPHEQSLDNAIKQLEARKDVLIKVKNSKKVELEILKQNITKMYDLLDYDKKNDGNEDYDKKDDGNNNEVSHDEEVKTKEVPTNKEDNVLTIEVETGNGNNEMIVESKPKDLVVTVESVVEETKPALRSDMTVFISPHARRSVSPEQAARLTRNDVLEAIYHADAQVTSAEGLADIPTRPNVSADTEADPGAEADLDADADGDDYQDDFSADVDNNYDHTRSNSSPVSVAASPDGTWDE